MCFWIHLKMEKFQSNEKKNDAQMADVITFFPILIFIALKTSFDLFGIQSIFDLVNIQ